MREQLRARLGEAWPELEIVGEARNGIEAVEQTAALLPDLVFLDIRMPGMTGIEAAREIAALAPGDGAAAPEIVFVTAYDEYAIEAFEQGVVDYLLKPADRERLAITVERIRKRLALRGSQPGAAPDGLSHEALQALLERLQSRLDGGQAT
ncbi:MAG: LytR/AlgR family response regulator transcription factor, partial [Burkholderiales bacterium]